MGTVIVGIIVLAIAGGAAYSLHRDKKNGKSQCGGDCSRCGGLYFSPLFAKIIILIVAAGHFYYFLFRIKTVDEQDSMELENECE